MNSTHLHIDPTLKKEIDAQGTREDCDQCRAEKGLAPKAAVDAAVAARTKSGHDTRQALEDVVQQLEEAEGIIDTQRGELKEKDAELARLKKELERLEKKKEAK